MAIRCLAWCGRTAPAALLAVLLALSTAGSPPVAFAHAELIGSYPTDGALLSTAPSAVRLSFSEPIERDFFALDVYTERRVRVDRRDARIPPGNVQALEASLESLPPGIYTAAWRVLSIDGHVVRGAISFSVGVAGRTPDSVVLPVGLDVAGASFALGTSVRWWTFLASFILLGGFAFGPLVLWPALGDTGAAAARVTERAAQRLLWIGWPSVVLLLLLTLCALLVQAADATGQPLGDVLASRALTRLLTGTKYGTLWLARMGFTVMLLAALAAVSVAPTANRASRWGRWSRWVGVVSGAALLLALAATGHASAVPRRTLLAIYADWLHLLAGALWLGGLVQLLVALPPALALLEPTQRRAVLARAVRRFSLLAAVSVLVIIATGTFASVIHVPTWQAMADTVYGAALSGKLLLIVPLLGLGAINLLVMLPRFVRAARISAMAGEAGRRGQRTGTAGAVDDVAGQRAFRRLVLGEVGLAALVLAVTGMLTGMPPATSAAGEGRPVRETARARDLTVSLEVDPNQAGVNTIRVTLADAQGRAVQAERVTLELAHQDMEMGQREVATQSAGSGRYEAVGGVLSMSGRWQAEVRVRRAGMPGGVAGAEANARFLFTVGQPAGTGRPMFSPARIVVNALTPQMAAGVLALFLTTLLFTQRSRLAAASPLGLGASAALLLLGVAASGGALVSAYRQSVIAALPVASAVPATAESLARGQQLYTQSCMVCHGASGRGDGPAGRTLRPPPADLRVHMAAGHTDAQLFEWVSNGVAGTQMPPFKDQLAAEDRWHLINYIRTFGDQSAVAPGATGSTDAASSSSPASPATTEAGR